MKTVIALAVLAFVAGPALAHYQVDTTDETYYVPDEGDAAGFLLHGDDFHVYQETNGLPGLQEEETVTEDGRIIPPDEIALDL